MLKRISCIQLLLFAAMCVFGAWSAFAQGTPYFRTVTPRNTDLDIGVDGPGNFDIILATGGQNGITVTLPNAAATAGRHYTIKKVDAGSGAVKIVTSQTIDGQPEYFLVSQHQEVRIVSDGTNWKVLDALSRITLDATTFPGANAGEKIRNAALACPASGCDIDARGFGATAQTINADPFAGIAKPIRLLTGPTTFRVNTNGGVEVVLPSNFVLEMEGTVFEAPPNGVCSGADCGILETRTTTATGSINISVNPKRLTLSSCDASCQAEFTKGKLVAVLGADANDSTSQMCVGAQCSFQRASLRGPGTPALSATETATLYVQDTTGFSGAGYARVDGEIVSYSAINTDPGFRNISSSSCSADVVTATSSGHGLQVNQYVAVTGSSQSSHNTVTPARIDSVPLSNTFTYTRTGCTGNGTGGTATVQTLNTLTRGEFGTGPGVSHNNGANVDQVMYWISEITNVVSATQYDLADNALFSVTNTSVVVGSQNIEIKGTGTFDGNKSPTKIQNHNLFGIKATLARRLAVEPTVGFIKQDHAGVYLEAGRDCTVDGVYEEIGYRAPQPRGTDLWVFGRAKNNTLRGSFRKGFAGPSIEDRSSNINTYFEGPGQNNVLDIALIEDEDLGFTLEGGHRNSVTIREIRNVSTTGILISSDQWPADPVPTGNVVNVLTVVAAPLPALLVSLPGPATNGGNSVHIASPVDPASISVAPGNFATWVDSTLNSLAAQYSGATHRFGGTLFLQTADKAVTGTAETSLISTSGQGSMALPANYLVVGKTVELLLSGHYSTDSTPGQVTFRVKIGGTLVMSYGPINVGANAPANTVWQMRLVITCRATGSNGTVSVNGLHWGESTPFGAASAASFARATDFTVNTTNPQTIDYTEQFSDAGNAQTTTHAILRALN